MQPFTDPTSNPATTPPQPVRRWEYLIAYTIGGTMWGNYLARIDARLTDVQGTEAVLTLHNAICRDVARHASSQKSMPITADMVTVVGMIPVGDSR
ncbi:MAG: hypothetical protein EPO06_11780 [Burkholderiaceae bacterium]|nr:MAG: hypothetical protein EPO06_11780 [Burkholderiaceae bacterium]